MNDHPFQLAGANLRALPTGALWWPEQDMLCVADLHFGKTERLARRGGSVLPPYEVRDTLDRLATDLAQTQARCVVCLGDSFDDVHGAAHMPEPEALLLASLQAGRRWIWIEGNHDPGPIGLGGENRTDLRVAPLTFRHIARDAESGEISGHYHPKARLKTRLGAITRPAFLVDGRRVIMPSYGTYTGGLRSNAVELADLMGQNAIAILTGSVARAVAMPR